MVQAAAALKICLLLMMTASTFLLMTGRLLMALQALNATNKCLFALVTLCKIGIFRSVIRGNRLLFLSNVLRDELETFF